MSRFRIGTLLLAGSLTIGTASRAAAVFPGEPGLLAFTSQGNIFTIAPDGLPPLAQLTFDGDSHHPRWSPSGDRIAFDRGGDIYVMAASGRNVQRLTTTGGNREPAWAPSGKRIVFVHRSSVGAAGDLWIVPANGGPSLRLTYQNSISCLIAHPSWSPLGGRIAYEWERRVENGGCSPARVVVMRIEPRERTVIPLASDPDFTADGRGVFFASAWDPVDHFFWPGEQLSWANLSGGQRQRLTLLFCAEGDPCLSDGVGSPRSAFPGDPSFAVVSSHVDGFFCIRTTDGGSFCTTVVPVEGFSDIDWQARPTG